jgi:uncharacterized protein
MDKTISSSGMTPFYFGVSREELYGCYHRPKNLLARSCLVVLCYPIGHEYVSSHRAIYQLAVRLSDVGFHVLRFDYFGCGDSAGVFEDGSLLQWTNDIHSAIAQGQKLSGLKRVCLIGLRIGATLALRAATDCRDLHSIVLWEPIFDGNLYLRELAERHRNYLGTLRGQKAAGFNRPGMPEEILGFLFTSKLKQDLEMIKADHPRWPVKANLLIISNEEKSDSAKETVLRNHPHASYQFILDPKLWEYGWVKRLPLNTLKFLVNWMGTGPS